MILNYPVLLKSYKRKAQQTKTPHYRILDFSRSCSCGLITMCRIECGGLSFAGSSWHRGCVNSVDDCQTSRELVFKCNQGERRRRLWRWQQQILKEQLQQPRRWQVFLIDRIDVECCHLRVSEIHMRDNSCASDLRPNPSPTTTCLPATFVDVSTSQVASFLLHDLRTFGLKEPCLWYRRCFFPPLTRHRCSGIFTAKNQILFPV